MNRFAAFCSALVILGVGRGALAQTPPTLPQGKAFIAPRITWCVNPVAQRQACPTCGCGCSSSNPATCPVTSAGEGGQGRKDVVPGSEVTVSDAWTGSAVDYATGAGVPACASCGAAAPRIGALPALEIRRYHSYRYLSFPSSFGQGVYSSYDVSLTLFETDTGTGVGSIILYDPRDVGPLDLSDPNGTGTYTDGDQSSIQGLQLYAGGSPVASQALATSAVLTTRDGWTYTFDVFALDTSPATQSRAGRLTRIQDRNGNAIVLAYQYALGSTPAQLGNDQTNLWKLATITDAYGRSAAFAYAAAKANGVWVVNRIGLPNGTSVSYTYEDSALLGLSGVSLPDGTTTTLSTSEDAETQTTVLHYVDSAAAGTDRVHDVYLSNTTWVDPVTQVAYPQSGNLARMIVNGAGEVTYLSSSFQDIPAGTDTYYVYEGGGSFFRYTTDPWGTPSEMDEALAWDLTQDPSTYSYQQVESYTSGLDRRILSTTDILGRTTQYDRDLTTGAVLLLTYPDTTYDYMTYNGFRQVTHLQDRIDRITNYAYDAQGNMLSKTARASEANLATWSWTYNAKGQPLTVTDADGHVTSYAYYPDGDLSSVTEPPDAPSGPQAVTTYQYDGAGRVTSVTDPRGRVTQYGYDARNRVTGITYNDGTVESHVYGTGADANLLIQSTDRLGIVTQYQYDAVGREMTRTEAAGRPEAVQQSWTYLAGTSLPSTFTDRGNLTKHQYDAYNRRVETTVQPSTAAMLTDQTAYDEARRVDFTTDRYDRRTFPIDDVNDRTIRTVEETVPNGVSPPPPPTDPASQAAWNAYFSALPRVLSGSAPYLITDTTYDAEGETLTRTDGRGFVTQYQYDGQGRTIEIVEAASTAVQATTQYQYDPEGNRTQVTAPRGFVTQYTYTDRNLLASMTVAVGQPEQATESYGYDLDRRRSLRTDGRGDPWSTVWSLSNAYHRAEIDPPPEPGDPRPVHAGVQDAMGHVSFEFVAPDATAFPNDASYDDPAVTTREITTRYDGLYRPDARTVWLVELETANPVSISENDPPIAGDPGYPAAWGLTTRWIYDDDLTDGVGLDATYPADFAGLGFGPGSVGSAVAEIDPAGDVTVTAYDGIGRVVRVVDGVGDMTTTTYDVQENGVPGSPGTLVETAVTDGVGDTTRTEYDGAGRELASYDATGNVTATSYDADGDRISTRDPNGVGWDAIYDARDRETSRTDTAGDTTQTAYDTDGDVVQTTDALGHTSGMVYDGRDRRTSSTDRIGGTTLYAYDANSNMASMTDAQGGVTSYQYDARNLKVDETYPDAGVVLYAYDASRRTTSRLDQAGATTRYDYDRADRMTQREYPDAQNDTFGYDAAGRMISATSARYDNTVGRTYDPANRMTSESLTTNGQTYTVGYAYDAADRVTAIPYPDGSVVNKTYTPRDQIATVRYAGSPVASFAYDAGMRRSGTTYGAGPAESRSYYTDNTIESIAAPGATGLTYTYNANKDPLTQGNSVNTGDAQSYGYDFDDRLTSFSRSNGDAQSWDLSLVGDWNTFISDNVTDSRTHDAVHELTSRNGQPLVYDAKGNLAQDDQGSTFAWDFENRMGSANVGGNPAQYTYDALFRRVSKTVGGQTTVYVYDGWRAIAEYAGGASPASPERNFVFGAALDEVLVMATGGHTYYYHDDDLLSVQAITDETGALVETYRYDPYGKQVVMTGAGPVGSASTIGNPYMYTGQRADGETGLFYYKNRYYSAVEGRFVGRDPVGYEGSTSGNLYEYARGAPTVCGDPTGEAPSQQEIDEATRELDDERPHIRESASYRLKLWLASDKTPLPLKQRLREHLLRLVNNGTCSLEVRTRAESILRDSEAGRLLLEQNRRDRERRNLQREIDDQTKNDPNFREVMRRFNDLFPRTVVGTGDVDDIVNDLIAQNGMTDAQRDLLRRRGELAKEWLRSLPPE
jgi:RHS repeat-associated protein